MKKYISLFTIVALAALSLVSCTESRLQGLVDQANANCPQTLGRLGEISGVELQDGQVVIFYTVSEEYTDMEALCDADAELMARNAVRLLRHQGDAVLDIMGDLASENAGLKLVFTGDETGKEFTLTISADEIAAVAASVGELDDCDEALLAHAELANSQCPLEVEPGVTLTEVTVEEEYYVYNFTVDQEVYTIEKLNSNKELAKDEILKSMDMSDPGMRFVVRLCGEACKGIAFRYTAEDAEEECLVIVEVEEVQPLMVAPADSISL